MPAISVVVITFNSERYIERCLRSLARQSLADFEAIVVDAGSTDRTRENVARFDERFRWLELPGSDMGAARNYGMRMSRGRHITFLDSDDFYLRDKLLKQVAELGATPTADVTFCAAWHFRTVRPEWVGKKRLAAQPVSFKDFVAGRNHNVNTMCLRRQVWEAGFGFGEGDRGRYGEEWRFQVSLAQHGVPMVYHMEPLVVVELRADSHTTWARQQIMKMHAIADLEHLEGLLTPAQRSTVDVTAIIDDFRCKLVIALLLDGQEREAMQTVRLIRDDHRARQMRHVIRLSQWVPRQLLADVLRRLWLLRQNQSFVWQAAPAALRDEFAAVCA